MKASTLILLTILFVIGASISNFDLWFTAPWTQGLVVGALTGLAYSYGRAARTVFSLLGLVLLLVTAAGGGQGIGIDGRSVFCGMSLGVPLGFLAFFAVFPARSLDGLEAFARKDDSAWLLKAVAAVRSYRRP